MGWRGCRCATSRQEGWYRRVRMLWYPPPSPLAPSPSPTMPRSAGDAERKHARADAGAQTPQPDWALGWRCLAQVVDCGATAARGKQARKRKLMAQQPDLGACGVCAWVLRAWVLRARAGRLPGRSWSKKPSASRLPASGISSPHPSCPPSPCVCVVCARKSLLEGAPRYRAPTRTYTHV